MPQRRLLPSQTLADFEAEIAELRAQRNREGRSSRSLTPATPLDLRVNGDVQQLEGGDLAG